MKKKSWNIEKCRNEFDTEEQWQLKRKFLEVNKNVLPRDRLICLAQVLVNIEFLGTRYPNETMKTVAELSKDIIDEFRQRRDSRLQRLFIGAAEAASAKFRGFQQSRPPYCGNLLNRNTSDLRNQSDINSKTASQSNEDYKKNIDEITHKNILTQENKKEAETGSENMTSKKRKKEKSVPAEEIITLDDDESELCVVSNATKEPVKEIETTVNERKKKKKKKEFVVSNATKEQVKEIEATVTERKKKKKKKELVELPIKAIQNNENQAETGSEKLTNKKRKRDKSVPAANIITLDDGNSELCVISNATKEEVKEIESTVTERKKKKKKKVKEELPIETIQDNENHAAGSENVTSKKKKRVKSILTEEIITLDDDDSEVRVVSDTTKEQVQIVQSLLKKRKKKEKLPIETVQESVVESTVSKKLQKNMESESQNSVNTTSEPQNFVLIMCRRNICLHPGYRAILESSARLSRVKMDISNNFLQDKGKWNAVLCLAGNIIATAEHEDGNTCSRILYKNAFMSLEKTHHKIVIEDPSYFSAEQFVKREEETWQTEKLVEGKLSTTSSMLTLDAIGTQIPKENSPVKSSIAMKMMKSMGWTEGSGLGAQKQGIVEAIKADVVLGREGLGFHGSTVSTPELTRSLRRYMQEYISSNSNHKIFFSKEFTIDQRKLIHSICRQMGLNSASIGKSTDRQLIVRRYDYQSKPLIKFLELLKITNKSDPIFEKVSLVPPGGRLVGDN